MDDEGVDEEGVGHCRPREGLREGHEEPETNQHHHVHVLVESVYSREDRSC